MTGRTLDFWRDAAGLWHWEVANAGGELVAVSGNGFTRRVDARVAATRLLNMRAIARTCVTITITRERRSRRRT